MSYQGTPCVIFGRHDITRDAPISRLDLLVCRNTLLTEGLPDREISLRLFISERTVHHHVSAVLAKIGVSSRTTAAREAARMGIGA